MDVQQQQNSGRRAHPPRTAPCSCGEEQAMSSAGMSSAKARSAPLARRFLAVFLVLHGFAHLVGAQGSWESASAGTAAEYLWGAWTISAPALLWVLAVAWSAAAVAYAHAAWLLWGLREGWLTALLLATAASLVLSILAMPMAVAGVVINVVLLAGAHTFKQSQRRTA
jgi:hypothetical protein